MDKTTYDHNKTINYRREKSIYFVLFKLTGLTEFTVAIRNE